MNSNNQLLDNEKPSLTQKCMCLLKLNDLGSFLRKVRVIPNKIICNASGVKICNASGVKK